MTERDFRYTLPDGSEVEGFQVTDASLFQDELSPDWMNSKMLLTKSDPDTTKTKHWLTVGEVETPIPAYGWIIKRESGTIEAVDYEVMESAVKLVREVPKVPDMAKPMNEGGLILAAKMTKKSLDECRIQDQAQVDQANRARQEIIDSMHPDDAAAGGFKQGESLHHDTSEPNDDNGLYEVTSVRTEEPPPLMAESDGLLQEVKAAYVLFAVPEVQVDQGIALLKTAIASRTQWCSCAPGLCDGERDKWECRQNSPLVQS